MLKIILALLVFTISAQLHAMGAGKSQPPTDKEVLDPGEPAYCDPKTFLSKEEKFKENGLNNANRFKLGQVTVVGLAVGNSDAKSLMKYATSNSTADAANKYCTWYYNEGNAEAEKAFTHIYLTNPRDLNTSNGPQEYAEKLVNQFANDKTSFLSCALDHKYMAMGCNGQKHRGPTVFGMMLSYSGCNPERAAKIVNVVWGLNGVKPEVRLAIIAAGKAMGDQNPVQRQQLQSAFGY